MWPPSSMVFIRVIVINRKKNNDTISCSYSILSRLNTKKEKNMRNQKQAHNTGLENVCMGVEGGGGSSKKSGRAKNKNRRYIGTYTDTLNHCSFITSISYKFPKRRQLHNYSQFYKCFLRQNVFPS